MWISNEYFGHLISERLINNDKERDLLLMISGGLFALMALLYFKLFKIDPIDSNIIINEQAINLTSKHSPNVQEVILLETFIDTCKVTEEPSQITSLLTRQIIKDSSESQNIYIKILRRWESPTLLQVFRDHADLIRMLVTTCAIFF